MLLYSIGIVLQYKRNSRYIITICDKKYGKIDCIMYSSVVSIGSLIEYTLQEQAERFVLRDIRTLSIPLELGRMDHLLFLHHCIEIILYYAPAGSCIEEVFCLFEYLYTVDYRRVTLKFKKFFILKLLTFLGIIPEVDHIRFIAIQKLSGQDIIFFTDDSYNAHEEKQLDSWLWCCIAQNPYSEKFKTVHFYKNRLI